MSSRTRSHNGDVREVLADPCSNGPLRYRLTANGCILYSVGPNGIDDGGAANDRQGPHGPDDIRIMF